MKDYQEAIDTNRLYFWCNSIGEINAVASKPACVGTEDDMPEKAKTLYQKYFDEATAARKYIVSTEDGYGLMLWLILDVPINVIGRGYNGTFSLNMLTASVRNSILHSQASAAYIEGSNKFSMEGIDKVTYKNLVLYEKEK